MKATMELVKTYDLLKFEKRLMVKVSNNKGTIPEPMKEILDVDLCDLDSKKRVGKPFSTNFKNNSTFLLSFFSHIMRFTEK